MDAQLTSLVEQQLASPVASHGLVFRIQSRMPVAVPAVMGGKRMDWNYSEIVSPEKWVNSTEAQASLKDTVVANWAARADEAGYKAQGKQTEILTPMWRDGTGTLVEAGEGDPVAYKFSVSGTVVPK